MKDELLTVSEFAARVGVSDRTVYSWIKRGKIAPDPEMHRYRRTLLQASDARRLKGERTR